MVLVIIILTISFIILLIINVISCLYINLLLSLIILYNTVHHYVYDLNKITFYLLGVEQTLVSYIYSLISLLLVLQIINSPKFILFFIPVMLYKP